MTAVRADAAVAGALIRRNFNELLRVPGAGLPGIVAPTIFMLGLTSVFGDIQRLPGFTADSFLSFLVAISLLQSASFSGAATGVNLARDIELGWFDRLLVSRSSRWVMLAGMIASASLRALVPMSVVLATALALGAHWPGPGPLLLSVAIAALFAAVAASWAIVLAIRFKTVSAAPLMQVTVFTSVLFTTSYAPEHLLEDWFRDIAHWNPITQVVEGVRQAFVQGVSWGDTWPALLVLGVLLGGLVAVALRGLLRMGE